MNPNFTRQMFEDKARTFRAAAERKRKEAAKIKGSTAANICDRADECDRIAAEAEADAAAIAADEAAQFDVNNHVPKGVIKNGNS
jgi:hypothetical protein